MEESVMRQHIDLYVNNYSLELGHVGRKAVKKLLDVYENITKTSPVNKEEIFIL